MPVLPTDLSELEALTGHRLARDLDGRIEYEEHPDEESDRVHRHHYAVCYVCETHTPCVVCEPDQARMAEEMGRCEGE